MVCQRVVLTSLLPLQYLSLSLFASNRDQDVVLAAVNAAYKARAISRNCEVSSFLNLNPEVFSLMYGRGRSMAA
jgi:hypothetical protein